jgi:thiol-disulfide isomerase/thioredoxin
MVNNYYSLYIKYKNKYVNLKSTLESINENKLINNINIVESFQNGGSNIKDVILFKAEWCGHCNNFKKHWIKLQETCNKNFNFITYDSNLNKEEILSWKIEGFPTIIIKKENEALIYAGPNEYNSVLKFITSV